MGKGEKNMKQMKFATVGILALALVFTAALVTGCSKKDSGGGSADGGDSKPAANKSSDGGKAAPATDFGYDLTEDGKGVVIKQYTGKAVNLVIPGEIEGYPVVEIKNNGKWTEGVFFGESSSDYGPGRTLKSVVISASVQRLGAGTFYGCHDLTKVTILSNSLSLHDLNWNNCENLVEFNFPEGENVLKLEYPGDDNFKNCGKLPLATRKRIQDQGYKGSF
jgi:hypothetical protein